MKKITRRSFLTLAALASTGCATRLPTNVAQNFKEEEICVNEDIIKMQKIGILGNWYFAIPLNTKEKILDYGEPSFTLIPEAKSRTSIKEVGEKGGEVIVDAPKGDLYLPYVYKTDGTNRELITDFVSPGYVRLKTNFNMNDIKKPSLKEGKITLEEITEKDFPFSDETLKTINNQQYIVFEVEDYPKFNDSDILPIYFVKTPCNVEFNRTIDDKKIRLFGETYLFKKGETKEDYLNKRGINIAEIKKEKEIEINQKSSTEKDQN